MQKKDFLDYMKYLFNMSVGGLVSGTSLEANQFFTIKSGGSCIHILPFPSSYFLDMQGAQ